MHRPTVGIIALVLLLLAVVLFLVGGSQTEAWQSGCQRVGLIMGAWWLAMPHLRGARPLWVMLALIVGLVAAMLAVRHHPLSIAMLTVIVLVLGYLSIAPRPRRPGRSR